MALAQSGVPTHFRELACTRPVCLQAGRGGFQETQGHCCLQAPPLPPPGPQKAPSSAQSRPLQRRRAFCPQPTVVMLTPGKRAAPGASDPTPDPSLEHFAGPKGRWGGSCPHPTVFFTLLTSHILSTKGWKRDRNERGVLLWAKAP